MKFNVIKALVASAALVGFGAVVAPAAHAQSSGAPVEKPIRIKIGTQFLLDEFDENAFHVGASYDFGKNQQSNPSVYSVYGDGFFYDGGNVFGVGAQIRSYFTPILAPTRVYGGAGIGAYFVNPDNEDDSTRFGGKVFLGAEFNQGLFGEVDITLPGDSDGNGLTLAVGYRF